MNKLKVYCAGPITGFSYDEVNFWRLYVEDSLGEEFEIISPMRNKQFLRNEEIIQTDYNELISTSKGIFCRDKWDVQRCDILLVNFYNSKNISIGTVAEIAWAHLLNKPIVLVTNNELYNHPFINEMVNFTVDNLDDAIEVIRNLR